MKQYILDTSVLIHDPGSLFQFQDNVVWIPVEVLEELDRFKPESTTRGANAREVHRHLAQCFKSVEDMRRGIELSGRGRLRIALNRAVKFIDDHWVVAADSERFRTFRSLFPDLTVADNRILANACSIADSETPPAILVTKDINMLLKARSLGLEAEDYRTDRVEDSDIRRTRDGDRDDYQTVIVPGHSIQAMASAGEIQVGRTRKLIRNEYVLLASEDNPGHGIPARHMGEGRFLRLRTDSITIRGGRTFSAVNLGQRFLLDALFDPALSLVTVYGKAGTGKTLLSVGAGLHQVQAGLFEKLLITRVIMPTGRDIGYLPGRMEEKMQPWVQPAYDALELLLSKPRRPEQFAGKRQSDRKGQSERESPGSGGPAHPSAKPVRPYEPLLQNGTLEIEAICHIRGRSIPHAIFIVDEAQQLTPHEAKTIVTRMGKGSKLILIGDLAQIDNPYVDANTNGLVFTRNRLQGQSFMAHVNLFKGERSEMAEIAANLM